MQIDAGVVFQGRDLVKRFGSLTAVNHVTVPVRKGEITVLLGENGAGKSTCLKILNGYLKPDSGSLYFEGQEVSFTSARDAMKRRIYTIYQTSSLIDRFTIAENFSLAFPRKSVSDLKEMVNRYEKGLDVNSRVALLPSGVKQRLEIVRALESDAKVLLLDEPTSVLAYEERDRFFKDLARLGKERGMAVLITTHKLQDAMDYCHEISVLKSGRVVLEKLVSETSLKELTAAMFGMSEEYGENVSAHTISGQKILEIENLSVAGDLRRAVKDVTFSIYKGEILGIIGVAGNGQVELAETIYGLRKPLSGSVGTAESERKVGHRLAMGKIGYLSDNPAQIGMALDLSVKENFGISLCEQASKGVLVDWKALEELTQTAIKTFEIKCDSPEVVLRELSGGNIQKVAVAREFSRYVDLLILVHPDKGLDLHTTYLVYDRLVKLARGGTSVLLISEDVDEVLYLADRIGVMYEGSLSEVKPKQQWKRQTIGALMTGAKTP